MGNSEVECSLHGMEKEEEGRIVGGKWVMQLTRNVGGGISSVQIAGYN